MNKTHKDISLKMTHKIVLLVLVECFVSAYAQSPCPEFFEYVRDGNAVYGMIHLNSDGQQLSSLTVRVNFTIATQLQSSYVGRLEPIGDDLLLVSFNAGHTISFRIHFPTTSPLPKLTSLTANDRYICGGPGDVLGPGSYVTTISLQTLLYLKTSGVSPGHYPNFISKPIDNKKVFITYNNNKKGTSKPVQVDYMYYNIASDPSSFSNHPEVVFENPSYTNTFNSDSSQQNPTQGVFQNNPNRKPPTQQNDPNDYPWEQNTQQQNHPIHQEYPSQNTQQKYPNQQNTVQNYPNQQNTLQNYPTQQNTVQNYPNQHNSVQSYPNQHNSVQSYPNQHNSVQSYPNQQNPVQNYPTQQYPVIYPNKQQTEPPKTSRPIIPIKPTVAPHTTTEASFYLDERFPSWKPTTSHPQQNSQSSNEQCGVTSTGNEKIPLIYKGDGFTRGDWPWLVALYKRKDAGLSFVCSGTLVSDRHIITAAHCMQTKASYSYLRDMVVKVGVYNLEDWGDDGTVTRILTSAVIHESYNASTLAHDILVAKFDKRVQFSDNIRPACLWTGSTNITRIVGTTGVVAGWGASESSSAGHGAARAVAMPVVSTASCRASRPDFHHLTSAYTLCAGDRNGAGPCLGDSGGGLYMMEAGRWRIRGIVSLSLRSESNSCNLNEYVVFTDAAQYLAWISYVMNT